jgi:hypothetical protein
MTETINLIQALKQFTGTEQWYRNPLFPKYLYTDGVKYLAEQAGAYWLIDYIFSKQNLRTIQEQGFQVWKLIVDDGRAIIKVEDGNENLIKEFKISYTDFPLKEFSLWFTDSVLLLPSEY